MTVLSDVFMLSALVQRREHDVDHPDRIFYVALLGAPQTVAGIVLDEGFTHSAFGHDAEWLAFIQGGADKNLNYLLMVQVFVRILNGSVFDGIQHQRIGGAGNVPWASTYS